MHAISAEHLNMSNPEIESYILARCIVMNKKGALELSVNAIVILIIALTILGLVLGFAVSKFRELSGQITINEDTPEATPQIPIQFPGGKSEITLSKAQPTRAVLSIYNPSAYTIDLTGTASRVETSCVGGGVGASLASGDITVTAAGSIDAGTTGEVPVVFTLANSVVPGEYSCKFAIMEDATTTEQVSRSLFINIE